MCPEKKDKKNKKKKKKKVLKKWVARGFLYIYTNTHFLLILKPPRPLTDHYPERERKREMEETKSRFKRICVFCGSSSGKKASYQEAAVELGKELVTLKVSFHCLFHDSLIYDMGSSLITRIFRSRVQLYVFSTHFEFLFFLWFFCVSGFPLRLLSLFP
jgi:hypothetical protein